MFSFFLHVYANKDAWRTGTTLTFYLVSQHVLQETNFNLSDICQGWKEKLLLLSNYFIVHYCVCVWVRVWGCVREFVIVFFFLSFFLFFIALLIRTNLGQHLFYDKMIVLYFYNYVYVGEVTLHARRSQLKLYLSFNSCIHM